MEQLTIRELQELWDEASLIKPHYSVMRNVYNMI